VSAAAARASATLFDPERLRLARQTAGLRKNELADLVGVTPAAITQYEQGHTRPRPAVVAAMSLALHCPVEYFLNDGRPIQSADPSGAFFRSLRSTRQYEREQAAARAELVWEVFAAIDAQAQLPAVDLPELELGEHASVDEIEQASTTLRDAWGLGGGPVANVVGTLEKHGVIVARLSADTARIDAFSQWIGGRPIVVLWDSKMDAARSRSDAAHELGHLVCHHDPEPGNKLLEDQAQSFAGALLMPAEEVGPYLPTRCPRGGEWADLFELKQAWGVSVSNLLYRAKTLGRLTDSAHRRAMIALSQRGWRTNEPADLGRPEAPTLLARAVELLEADRGMGVEQLARDLKQPIERVLDVLGVAPKHRLRVE
jgi:Zn-dependent peptidase ImmA (M78 family)/transcriptional regulator with XRE-family HTH domain